MMEEHDREPKKIRFVMFSFNKKRPVIVTTVSKQQDAFFYEKSSAIKRGLNCRLVVFQLGP